MEEEDPKSKPFIPFSGLGRRLGGKASAQPVEETSRPELKQKETDKETKNFDSSPTNTALCKSFGNLVFGSNVTTSSIQATPKVILSSSNFLDRQKCHKKSIICLQDAFSLFT